MSNIIPSYLNVDFDTLKEKFRQILKESDTFKDVNYEGSNISVLIELLSYIGELNTFYLNKIAKNLFLESSELYETTHSLGMFLGYKPRGYISSTGNVDVTIKNAMGFDGSNGGFNLGDTLYVGRMKSVVGDNVNFLISDPITFTASLETIEIELNVIQGEIEEYILDYEDMLTDKFILENEKFSHNEKTETAFLFINGEQWEQKDSLYKDLSIYSENRNVFELTFDKYKRYNIQFSGYGNKPQKNDSISLQIVKTLGANGNLGPYKINQSEEYFVFNITQGTYLNPQCVAVTNNTAITGGEDFNSIDYIKLQGKTHFNTQERLVTKKDYVGFLRGIPEIALTNVYGEQEIYPLGDLTEYNKIHIVVYPEEWGPATIDYTTQDYTINEITASTLVPTVINDQFKNDIKSRIEAVKFINTFEVFELPEIVYFIFRFGIKEQKLYSYDVVATNVKKKIEEYFSLENINFNSPVDFRHLQNWIINPKTSLIDISGLETFIVRDVDCLNYTIEEDTSEIYPKYENPAEELGVENKLRNILLNYKQIPQIVMNLCVFTREG